MFSVFGTDFWSDVVWALLHSIWQAAVVVLLLGLVLRQVPAKRAVMRYWIAVFALGAVVLATFVTHHARHEFATGVGFPSAAVAQSATTTGARQETIAGVETSTTTSNFASHDVAPRATTSLDWTAFAAVGWIIGVCIMLVRTAVSAIQAQKLGGVARVTSEQHIDTVERLCKQLGVTSIPTLWSSEDIVSPFVLGVLSPAIVVPLSMLTSLSGSELASILAHEVAHLRRNDYLANLFQLVIEAVYFFNPAVWWISWQIRSEREACCDQLAIMSSSNNIAYATTLAGWMERIARSNTAANAPVALSFADEPRGKLLERIQRILTPDHRPRLRVSLLNVLFVLFASALIAAGMNAGSKVITTAAAKILTDSERVAKIEEQHENVQLPGGRIDKGEAVIRGRLITEDRKPIERGWLYSRSENAGHSHGSTEGSFDSDFEVQVHTGRVSLHYFSDNYAPAIVGPFIATKDETVLQDIKLTKGNPHTIRVLDENKQPIKDAHVSMNPVAASGGPVKDWMTDKEGQYRVLHTIAGIESRLIVKKKGYEDHRANIINNGQTIVTLKKSPITKGTVISHDGLPIEGAEINIITELDNSHNLHLHRDEPLAKKTDKNGQFETDLLSSTGIFELFVKSEQGIGYIDNVVAGDAVELQLKPACFLDFVVRGDQQAMRRNKDGSLRFYIEQNSNNSRWRGNSASGDISIIAQTDKEVRLRLGPLWPGKFKIQSGVFNYNGVAKSGSSKLLVMSDAKTRAVGSTASDRVDVTIRFTHNGQSVKPGGELHLAGTMDDFEPLEEGQLKARLKPGRHYLQPHHLIGFTFKSQAIMVKPNESNAFTLEVEPAGAVSGRIVDHQGNPISSSAGCEFEVSKPGLSKSSGLYNYYQSDADGRFLLSPIPLDATVIVKAGERFNPAISDPLEISAKAPMAELTLKTAEPRSAKVQVLDVDGKPIPNAKLTVRLIHSTKMSWTGSLVTNALGEREITPLHPNWKYAIEASRAGYVKSTAELLQAETTVLHMPDGKVVRGRLLDQTGEPLSNRTIYAERADKLPYSSGWVDADQSTDRQGYFEFTTLEAAEYRIRARVAKSPMAIVHTTEQNGPITLQVSQDNANEN